MSEAPIPVVVISPQDRITRFVGKNWKSVTGALIIAVTALAWNRGWIDAPTADLFNKAGEALLGFGIAHKLERLIQAYQSGGNAAAIQQLLALLQGRDEQISALQGVVSQSVTAKTQE